MTESDILAHAEERIQRHRTADVVLKLVDDRGRPVTDAEVHVRLKRHAFKIGCNAFRLFTIEEDELQAAYDEQFTDLFNYATLPFYWGSYERDRGQTQQERLEHMVDWATARGIEVKGHPLAWHEVFPEWAEQIEDREVIERLERRVGGIVSAFRSRIDIWDVFNEATVSRRHDNAIGRWVDVNGPASCVAQTLMWARAANPDAVLLYNDFNISAGFEELMNQLVAHDAPVDAVGVQSHMHCGPWPIERLWDVCDTYGRFHLPVHFTELTILSGRLKPKDENDWHKRHEDWPTTPEGEEAQAEYGSKLYTVLFSHPAIEAVTWWDFTDLGSWQGAPAGMVRNDMSPKPLYIWLLDAFGKRWSTDVTCNSDPGGVCRLRAYFGSHQVEARLPNGLRLTGDFELPRDGHHMLTVTLRA